MFTKPGYYARTAANYGSSSVKEPVTFTSDEEQRSQNKR